MAIQIPNPGTGNGATGDNEFVLWSKVKSNFEDQTNAASRLLGTDAEQIPLSKNIPSLLGTAATKNIGTAAGQVPLAQDVANMSGVFDPDMTMYQATKTGDANDFEIGSKYLVTSDKVLNCPTPTDAGSARFLIETSSLSSTANPQLQIATVFNDRVGRYIRIKQSATWLAWQPMSITPATYNTTTAAGANVVVDAAGRLTRASSSERYKDIIADLELDDEHYADAMSLNPIIYRSKSEIDNPNHHYYSFSAEELGAYDPAFTLWRETETVTDEDGNVTEQPLAERQAEGINLNAIVAFLHATNIKQDKTIKSLEARIEAIEIK